MRRDFTKRLCDLLLGIPGTIALAPLMLVVAIAVALRLGRPIVFKQIRSGKEGHPFTLYKFRTMRDLRDQSGQLIPDQQRLTPFGAWLRSTSLDELPELLNVMKGEMSLVGPRPLLMQYLDRYTPAQARRHEIRPGLTGWAQVSGRNALTWEERFALDIWYIDHWSFTLDLRILMLTLAQVVQRKGIAHPGQATMQEFVGSSPETRL